MRTRVSLSLTAPLYRSALVLAVGIVALMASAGAGAQSDSFRPKPPNILLILADDLGFSDLGCYGGEARTPNLDRLAMSGLRFTQFYNTTRCWPSRAAILTGFYAQQVRRDTVPGVLPNGTQGTRPAWARLLPEMLRPQGYRSYHSGKWHLDGKPIESGFDRSYWLEDTDRFFSPRVHFEDDRQLPPVEPGSDYYAATRIADHAIASLKDHAANHHGRPFFEYLAFTSPHFPLHAPLEDVQRNRRRFRQGWDHLRERRLARMRQMGIVDCDLSSRTEGVPAWDSLTRDEQETWQTHMAIHAAMVDRMDREIGRVLEQVRAMGAMDDTLILFLSDNGASAEKLVRGDGHDPSAPPGSAKTFLCLEPGWANLANAPFRLSKMFVHEGGIATSFIAHWQRGIPARGELRHSPTHVVDLVPTILELAGAPAHGVTGGAPLPPGRSLVPALKARRPIDRDDLWWFHNGNSAVRVGEWKLVRTGPRGAWELYDLRSDRGETRNLAEQHPERVRQLEEVWNRRMAEFRALAERSAKRPK